MKENNKGNRIEDRIGLVFIREGYVRDAQAYTGRKIIEGDIHDDEDGWQDIRGPVLCAVYHNSSITEIKEKISAEYPDAPEEVFKIVTAGQIVDGSAGYFD